MTHDDPIYLDHNATTPLLPEVVDAMLPYSREHYGNPSSSHIYGVRARSAVARARDQVAAMLGCNADEVIFRSGGTEANNLAIRGVTARFASPARILTTIIEHPATIQPCHRMEAQGWRVFRVGVDHEGIPRTPGTTTRTLNQPPLKPERHDNGRHASGYAEIKNFPQAIGRIPAYREAPKRNCLPHDLRALDACSARFARHLPLRVALCVDTSVLVALFLNQPHRLALTDGYAHEKSGLAAAAWRFPGFASALDLKQRTGAIDTQQAQSARGALRTHGGCGS